MLNLLFFFLLILLCLTQHSIFGSFFGVFVTVLFAITHSNWNFICCFLLLLLLLFSLLFALFWFLLSFVSKQVNLGQNPCSHAMNNILTDCSDLNFNDTMTCQELLAFSVAFSAALPTNQNTLDSLYSSLANHELRANSQNAVNRTSKKDKIDKNQQAAESTADVASNTMPPSSQPPSNGVENFSCCYQLYQNSGRLFGNICLSLSLSLVRLQIGLFDFLF